MQEYGPILIYCFVTVILSFSMACFSIFFMLRASQNLHDDMTKSVLRAKISFFDTNPLGRILNRFSADTGITDDLLPTTLYDFLVSSTYILSIDILLSYFGPFVGVCIFCNGWCQHSHHCFALIFVGNPIVSLVFYAITRDIFANK